MLTLQHITTGYAHKTIGNDLSGHLKKGTLTALLGLNGCGKSTLLRTIARLQAPLEGEIFIEGKALSNLSIKAVAKQLSIVLTFHTEAPRLTATDIVKAGRIPYASPFYTLQLDDKALTERAFKLTHTEHLASRCINTLSDGERQRIFIAKAIAQDTPIILLDEPTAYLDFANKVNTMQLLKHLAKAEGKTILLSTHDVELAFHFADSLWLLRPDSITEGSPHELAKDGTIDKFFNAEGIHFDAEQMHFLYK